jgi:predicted ABC-type transport system involved in lysophospholipase L1 biosynthesis ATPase subunit
LGNSAASPPAVVPADFPFGVLEKNVSKVVCILYLKDSTIYHTYLIFVTTKRNLGMIISGM